MEKIKELIVVEGKHDAARLQSLYDCDVVCTGGLSLTPSSLDIIRSAAEKQGVIIMTDSDNPGETIRKKLLEMVPDAQVAIVPKKQSIGARNVGIEFADDESIREALRGRITLTNREETLSWPQYCELGIMGNKALREKVCLHFRVGLCNNKTLFKRLNMLGVDRKAVLEVING